MNYGFLSAHFSGVVAKRLSAVEADTATSNQHEFNGVSALRKLLGDQKLAERPATFLWVSDENEAISDDALVTWYDAREAHPTRTEWRLYFKSNAVMELAGKHDLLMICLRPDDSLLFIVVPSRSILEHQFAWLFGLDGALGERFQFSDFDGSTDRKLDFAARYVLDEIGIELEETETDELDRLLAPFKDRFPSTRAFSELARASLPSISSLHDPDQALLEWITREDALFRRMERKLVADRLATGFVDNDEADVDGFLKFSLSVQNRRKSRMGLSLENHLEAIFADHSLRFVRGAETENRSKPDFLFPGAEEYHDPQFPVERLTMLGAKSTCKDRWRQVLSEAERIELKHLLTLEPSISTNQTDEMAARGLRLVLPRELHGTYNPAQQSWLLDVQGFISLATNRQI